MPKCEECVYFSSCHKPYECSLETQYQIFGRPITKENWEYEDCIAFEKSKEVK